MHLFSSLVIIILSSYEIYGTSETTETNDLATPSNVQYIQSWESWIRIFTKSYYIGGVVDDAFQAYISNYKEVSQHNIEFAKGKQFYRKDLNKFADRPKEQLLRKLKSPVRAASFYENLVPQIVPRSSEEVPDYVNWSLQGWTSTYKANNFFPNGWSFSSVKAVEAHLYNATGKYQKLSRQEVEDCAKVIWARARITTDAFSYIMRYGITNDDLYPMQVPNRRSCKRGAWHPYTTIKNYQLLEPEDEENLKFSVALIGPISVSIKVTANFFFYQSGVFFDPACEDRETVLNHAVLLVGYGTDQKLGDFWIIQNNWGNRWGEGGYGRMARNTLINCGIASAAVYPVL